MGVAWKKCHKLKTSHVIKIRGVTKMRQNTIITLFKTEELFLINYPVLLTPDLGCDMNVVFGVNPEVWS